MTLMDCYAENILKTIWFCETEILKSANLVRPDTLTSFLPLQAISYPPDSVLGSGCELRLKIAVRV